LKAGAKFQTFQLSVTSFLCANLVKIKAANYLSHKLDNHSGEYTTCKLRWNRTRLRSFISLPYLALSVWDVITFTHRLVLLALWKVAQSSCSILRARPVF